jgi:hypothetical protein
LSGQRGKTRYKSREITVALCRLANYFAPIQFTNKLYKMRKSLICASAVVLLMSGFMVACNKGINSHPSQSSTSEPFVSDTRAREADADFNVTFNNGVTVEYFLIDGEGDNSTHEADVRNEDGELLATFTKTISLGEDGNYSLNYYLGEELVSSTSFKPNSYPGDCSKLGSRQKGESYDDCFGRNWSNFCCDFSGCMAQSMTPPIVAAAIGISCAFNAIATLPEDDIAAMTITQIANQGGIIYEMP